MDRIASSVSIIGGADGPTSIFIAGKLGGDFWLGAVAVGIIIVGVIVCILLNKHK